MHERHELFDELDAFDPYWQRNYPNLFQAVDAAVAAAGYVRQIYLDFISSEAGLNYLANYEDVPDVKGAVEAAQKAEQESPYFQRAMQRFNAARGDEWNIDLGER